MRNAMHPVLFGNSAEVTSASYISESNFPPGSSSIYSFYVNKEKQLEPDMAQQPTSPSEVYSKKQILNYEFLLTPHLMQNPSKQELPLTKEGLES